MSEESEDDECEIDVNEIGKFFTKKHKISFLKN